MPAFKRRPLRCIWKKYFDKLTQESDIRSWDSRKTYFWIRVEKYLREEPGIILKSTVKSLSKDAQRSNIYTLNLNQWEFLRFSENSLILRNSNWFKFRLHIFASFGFLKSQSFLARGLQYLFQHWGDDGGAEIFIKLRAQLKCCLKVY